jgi:shikimate dehydrogenase
VASPRPSRWLPDGRTRLLGIVGDPLAHSLSPALHTAVLRRLDRNLIYLPFPVTRNRLAGFLRRAPEMGILGLNVTTPYKDLAFRHVAAADAETRRTRMVNTLRCRGGRVVGFGTDGQGIVDWLEDAGLEDEAFGVLGFGATARSLVHRAWWRGRVPACVITRRPDAARRRLQGWASREPEPRRRAPARRSLGAPPPPRKARRARREPRQILRGAAPLVLGWAGLRAGSRLPQHPPAPRVWISTLPPGVRLPVAFWRLMDRRSVLLDLNYGAGRTGLAEEARSRSLRAADGLGPLLHQAARSLSFWMAEPVPVELFRWAAGRSRRSLHPTRG